MDDKELLEQLARGPLPRNGFDESLRKRIHERINNPRRRTTRFWNLPAGRAGLALSTVLVVLLGIWSWNQFNKGNLGYGAQATKQASAMQQPIASIAEAEKLNAAMLIGLRKDLSSSEQGYPGSDYRTVLVVPQDDELTIAAEGPGIYMPFKQKFWKITTVPDPRGKGVQILVAAPADEAKSLESINKPSDSLITSEKLLFAGNRYLSVLQTSIASVEGAAVNESNVWVNEVEHLLASNRIGNSNNLEKKHYTLAEVLGLEAIGSDIHRWTIARAQGKWVAKQLSDASKLSNAASVYDLQQISFPLTSKVTGPDMLALEWDEITAIEPYAEDAFTSSTEDILAVVMATSIDLYPYKLPKERMKPLRIETAPNESIIMVQWAETDYIDSWKKQLSKWIPPTATPRL
ncbi:hypothetical protein [Cohnella sp.]|uniref:hypothetical protein n=1 Tax=Cohnella sp. TaxID=1883426 RepID=UPI00356AD446